MRAMPEHAVSRRPTNWFMPCASISIKIQETFSKEVANIMFDLTYRNVTTFHVDFTPLRDQPLTLALVAQVQESQTIKPS